MRPVHPTIKLNGTPNMSAKANNSMTIVSKRILCLALL